MADVMTGWAGTAESVPLRPVGHRATPDQDAALACWLIVAPGQAAAWDHYLVSIIHLRPIEGVKPANIRIEGATHEMILCALDPEAMPRADDPETFHPLLPLNAECQFRVNTDEQAIELGEQAVKTIVDGRMPAEPAFQEAGRRMWQDAVRLTALHIVEGRHG